ncbi:MAG: hypothetical protein C5B48_00870 [Candidatus Rokuibacteriota bacterium]|nr:MAG: hypothetical protein C5B48_00870 [Candidatus Rokubacteria bacterium]
MERGVVRADDTGVKRLAVVGCLAAGLVGAAHAAAAPRFGAAEDATKYAADGGASLFVEIRTLGMTENRMVVHWSAADPTHIQEKAFLDRAIPAAQRAGIRIVFSVYPTDATGISADIDGRLPLFVAYLQTLARTYPSVTTFIVGNEPNEAHFWQPQLAPDGTQLSAGLYERLLAASYDALKAVSPAITVVGAGPSGDGNDTTSTSPVRFIAALGAAYRASGRAAPLMDQLAFHVYPGTNTDSPSKPRDWPNIGPSDLDRLEQAVWDAFAGTAQPTFPEGPAAPGSGLSLMVDEFGWQAAVQPGQAGYYGVENVPTVSEDEQAAFYASLIGQLSCNPVVSDAMVFHLVDEADLARFQSGLLRADRSQRPAFGAVRDAIAAAGSCATPHLWSHAAGVIGADATFPSGNVAARQALFGVSATAAEDALGTAGIFRLRSGAERVPSEELSRALASSHAARAPVRTVSKAVKAGWTPRFEFRGRLKPGWYVYAIRLQAQMNPNRAETLVSARFRVGRASKRPT